MIAIGCVLALALWTVAALTLTEFEINVCVLRPWQRKAYGLVAFVVGVVLAAKIGGAW